MIWLFEHGKQLFILFAFPLLGLAFDYMSTKKTIVYTLIISLILFSPILFGYSYIASWVYPLLGLMGLGSAYALYSRQIEAKTPKIISAAIISGLLFLILSFFMVMDVLSGSLTVENKWNINKYKIEYQRDQGFAGGPLMKYELSEYGFIPIFIKKVEITEERDTVYQCEIPFVKSKIIFDKCDETLKNTR
ncbi:MAG: hypothetical protein V4613_02385 [Bacteroidota bacterium]